ncbi:MAG: BACON domain-containing protein, partial [Acidobacteria bacterium]|nr:BACON domain-containing protein [Acidobacteriota bacterium]
MSSGSMSHALRAVNGALHYFRLPLHSIRGPRTCPRLLVGVMLSGVALAGCNSSSTTVAGPTPVKCQVNLASGSGAMDAAGGAGLVSVGAQPECAWSASTQAPWISDLTPREGQGNAQVQFRVAANPTATTRQGEVVVNDNRIAITQAPATCSVEIATTQHAAEVAGGTIAVNVTAITGCAWTATSSAAWISVSSSAAGNGSGTVNFTVAPNTGPARTGTASIGGRTLTVTQAAFVTAAGVTACVYTVTPTSHMVPTAGGSGTLVTVATTAECSWSAVSAHPWITVVSGATGQGAGTVSLAVAANTGSTRAGTIAVADRVVTITQSGVNACSYAISPTSQAFQPSGGAGARITVTTTSECPWTVTSDAAWLTATSPATGTGNGEVTFSVAANPGSNRTAVLVIGSQRFTVTQAAAPPCTFAISPTSGTVDASGDSDLGVSVSAEGHCNWTASSGVSWITVASGSTGSGSGTVGLRVAANTGGERNGSVTIAGRTFTVRQVGVSEVPPPQTSSCGYILGSTTASASATGGTGAPVAVTTTNGCSWTVTSSAPWLTIASATGSGTGQVVYNVAANTGPARTGTLTIAGQTFSVTQAAVATPTPEACVFAISPTTFTASTAGGAGPNVT